MPGRAVVGRAAELDVVDAFLAALDDGPARLLVEGEPGIGKTTVWQAATARARERGFRILASRPGSSETRLTFAGLGDFLSDVDDDDLEALPAPQRRALRVALLRDDPDGPAPEQREVSTAFLGILRVLAAETSVLVAVDDLQWLDRPSRRVLEFALRRLESERVGVLAAARPGGDWASAFVALRSTRIALPPLSLASLHEVLKAELAVTFPRPTLVRIEAVSSGNPFFAIELARALVERGEPVHGSAPLPVPDDLTELIAGRLRRLPAGTRRALLAAAALSTPTLDLLDRTSIRKAEAAGVVSIDGGGGVRFAHPLLAASVYANASVADRRAVHRKLAVRVTSPEERARHLALAAEAPDEKVAGMLAEAARAARERGAPDAAIELLELACDLLTPEEAGTRDSRRLELGGLLSEAGDPERATTVLRDIADNAPGPVRARALLLLAFRSETSQAGDAVRLCDAALEASEDDPELRVEILAAASRMSDDDVGRKATYAHEAHELATKAAVRPELEAYALLALAEAEFFVGRGLRYDLVNRAAELEEAAAGARQEGRSLHRIHHYEDVRPSARLLGILRIYADELDDAREEFERERDIALAHGDEVQLARTLIRLAVIETKVGQVAARRDVPRRGRPHRRSHGARVAPLLAARGQVRARHAAGANARGAWPKRRRRSSSRPPWKAAGSWPTARWPSASATSDAEIWPVRADGSLVLRRSRSASASASRGFFVRSPTRPRRSSGSASSTQPKNCSRSSTRARPPGRQRPELAAARSCASLGASWTERPRQSRRPSSHTSVFLSRSSSHARCSRRDRSCDAATSGVSPTTLSTRASPSSTSSARPCGRSGRGPNAAGSGCRRDRETS